MSKLDRDFDPHAPFEKEGQRYASFVSYLKGEPALVDNLAHVHVIWGGGFHGIRARHAADFGVIKIDSTC